MPEIAHAFPTFNNPDFDLTFLSTEENHFTYGKLYSITESVRQFTAPLNPSENNPLLIFADSSEEVVLLIAACFLLKIPIVPVHKNNTKTEIHSIIDFLKPCGFFAKENPGFERLNNLPSLQLSPKIIKKSEKISRAITVFDEPEKIVGYFLTSGSSGFPKVVPVKRRQVFFGAAASARNFKPSPNKYWLLCMPLNHVGGINVIYRSILYHSAIFLVSSFDTVNIRSLLHENKDFEAASMVPTMLQRLLDHKFFRVQYGFKALLIGGGPISMQLINKALTRGLPVVTSYGMTETCAQIAANPMLRPSGAYIPKKSVGEIFEPNQIQIRDDNGKALLFNESGQIWLKGPQVFDGYLDASQNTRCFDSDGWFNTGDFGHLNSKNQLFIENRRSDLIITGGENVNPFEVEEHINRFPGVEESAVVGVPDKKWGQMVVAFIVLSDGNLNRHDIKKRLKENLQNFKIPKKIISVEHLPKTPSQKVKKSELLKWYIDEFIS